MPNEIYHRSEWGNPKAEGFGDVYFDASATNKLYKHSDYYENSDGTDKILRDIPNKASIVLTPTAYSDGSLNTVIPPYQVSSELVTNGNFDTDSDWNKDDSWSISGGKANYDYISGRNLNSSTTTLIVGKTYQIEYTISNYISGSVENSSAETQISNNSNGTYTEVFTARYTFLRFRGSTNGEFSIDNVSVKEVQEADFDFSRGSSATRVNEKGLIEDVQILSSNLVQNGDFEEIGSEISNDVNFDNPSNWSLTGQSTISNGKAHIVQNDALNTGITANTTITNKTYKITGVVSDYISGSVGFASLGSTSPRVAIPSENGAFTIYYTSTRSAPSAWNIQRISSPCDLKLDNVSVKEVGQNWTFGTGWSIEDGKAVSDGSQTGTSFLYQLYSFTSGKKYRITYDIEVISGSIFSRLAGGGSTVDGNTQTASGTYTDDLVASVNHTNISFGASNDFVGSIDNISVIEITDDTDIPRIDYTSGQGALLLEPQSTNLLPYSEDFSQFSSIGSTQTVVEITNPIDTTAYKIESSVNTPSRVYVNAVMTNGNTYSSSYLVKASSNSPEYLGFACASNSQPDVLYDFANDQFVDNTVSGNAAKCESISMSNGWKLLKVPVHSSVANTRFNIYQGSLSGGVLVSTIGEHYFIKFAQLEQKSFATSYIPTEGSTVTRSADVANNSGNADLFNDSEGVLYANIAALDNDGTSRQISISNGGTTERVYFGFRANANEFILSSRDSSYLIANISDVTTFNKYAFQYKSGSFKAFINGFDYDLTLDGGLLPTGLNTLNFDSGAGNQPLYGNTKELAVFKEALTDAELESLTSWVSFTEMATDLEYTLE